ncbi:(2Fe-2S)-binding protein [Saliphagus sp. LR7]|uniref:(2Fe-2S)-binding protein n=1 Tax=Saliphagus sp. LR7 TaxID=2282654 RepID=UPI000DF73B85|nr:(2Fe-2S)-binding protein [Saliphagus sp. LR7]
MATHEISLTVNGEDREFDVESGTLLVHALRDQLGYTGPNVGCESTVCGACTVRLDGDSVKSCTVLAVQADGSEVTTVSGLADGDDLHPLQESFRDEHALQCGYCTPGMLMSSLSLLEREPDPDREEIREGIEGNLCRCTGYEPIVDAVEAAAGEMRGGTDAASEEGE